MEKYASDSVLTFFKTLWFTICVRPKYLEDRAAIKALAARRNSGDEKKASKISVATPVGSSGSSRAVYMELGFVPAGFYEWQVMAVSLAGNGSWTETKHFEVKVDHGLQPCKFSSSSNSPSSGMCVALWLMGFVFSSAFDFYHLS